jgi:signal transduction histidine kinase
VTLPRRRRDAAGLVLLVAVAVALTVPHGFHAAETDETAVSLFLGALLPVLLNAALVAGTVWLARSDVAPHHFVRVASWCIVGALTLAAGSGAIVAYQRVHDVGMADPLYVVVNSLSYGALFGFVVGVYDSRQRTAGRAASEARDRAEQLSNQLTVLNRLLRHDLRNSANVVKGQTTIMAERGATDDRLRTVYRQANDLVELGERARIIERLLREEGTIREPVDVTEVVDEHLERLRRDHPAADVDGIEHTSVTAMTHPLVSHAVSNVLDNAVTHNDADEPLVDVSLDCDAETVTLCVADDGPGIPDNEVAVLERGYETSLEHTSGLGLWLVNWIVDASDGHVWFEENDPRGSVVALEFEREGAT